MTILYRDYFCPLCNSLLKKDMVLDPPHRFLLKCTNLNCIYTAIIPMIWTEIIK